MSNTTDNSEERSESEVAAINATCENFLNNMSNYFHIGVEIKLFTNSPDFLNIVWSTSGADRSHKYTISKLFHVQHFTSQYYFSFVDVQVAKTVAKTILADTDNSERDIRLALALEFIKQGGANIADFVDRNRWWRLKEYLAFIRELNSRVSGQSLGHHDTFFCTHVSAAVYCRYYRQKLFNQQQQQWREEILQVIVDEINSNFN